MLTRRGGRAPRRLLALAALLALLGAAALWLGLSGPREVPAEEVRPLTAAPLAVGVDGLSLWSHDPDAWTDAVCTAGATTLLRPVAPYAATVGGRTLHEVARTPPSLAPGSYPVACSPAQEVLVGPHAATTAAPLLRGPAGVVLGAGLAGVALVLLVAALVARRRRARLEAWRVPPHRLGPPAA